MPTEVFTCARPHPDIENHVVRRGVTYYVTSPEGGINAQTGVILAIEGYGSRPCSVYAGKLRGYLAAKYNCLCVTVGYFGQQVKFFETLVPAADFFVNLSRYHGVSITAPKTSDMTGLVLNLIKILADSGITELHPSCRVVRQGAEYQSFGLLPAIDHLQVLHEVLLRYPVNRARIYAFGTSYGGYIALLLGKFAPATFRMIVDNSGFTEVNSDVFGNSRFTTQMGGLKLITHEPMVWSSEPDDPHYFAPHHALIRDVSVSDHLRPTSAHYYCYHYEGDTVAPLATKLRFTEAMRTVAPVALTVVGEGDIDGSLFKEATHGMRASLRQLFDRSHAAYCAAGADGAESPVTDFDQGTVYDFRCAGFVYRFRYSVASGVAVDMDRVAAFP